MPCFVTTSDSALNAIIELNRPLFRIGRHARTCDFVLDHPAISRLHLIVRNDSGRTFAADNNSRNGTLINGDPLIGERELIDGDVIEMCGIILEFRARCPSENPIR